MEYKVDQRPAYSILKVFLDSGEKITAEAGAMVYMKGDVDIKTHTGGVMRAVLRGMLGGEALFLNTYTARTKAELWFAPSVPGDIHVLDASEGPWIIQDTSYLGHFGDIEIGVAWRGLKGFFTEGELVWVKAEGNGLIWINSYGSVEKIELKEGETAVIDNMHFVAMPAGVEYKIRKFGGWKSFFLGGEGLVAEVCGPATVYVQTRTIPMFAKLLNKFIPRR